MRPGGVRASGRSAQEAEDLVAGRQPHLGLEPALPAGPLVAGTAGAVSRLQQAGAPCGSVLRT